MGTRERQSGRPSAAERYTRSLIEATLDPLVIIGVDATISDVNEATVHATGVERAELIGTDFASYCTEPDNAARAYRTTLEFGAVTDLPLTIRHVDGRLTDVLYNATVMRDEDGRTIGVLAAARDITTRLAAEDELRAANRRLAMLSATNQALLRTETEAELFNEVCMAATTVGGYRLAWVGEPLDEGRVVRPVGQAGFERGYLERANISWADDERGRGPTGRAIREGTLQQCTDYLRDPRMAPWRAGAIKQGYASSVAVPFPVEDRMFVLSVYGDRPHEFGEDDLDALQELADDLAVGVAARRARAAAARATAQLRESEAQFRQLFDWSPVGIAYVDLDGTFVRVNRRLGEITGYGEGLVGKTFGDITHPDDLAADVECTRGLQAGDLDTYSMEKRYISKDGATVWVDLWVTLVRDADGRPMHFVSAVKDIALRKQAQAAVAALTTELEDRVRERTEELQRANDNLEAFTYTVSHDLRAPLRSVIGFTAALQEDYGDTFDDTASDYARRIRAAAERMSALIDDLLQLSRLGRAELHTLPTDLSEIVRSIADELGRQYPDRQVDVAIEDGVVVQSDRRLITTALQNLLENAWKFTAGRSPAHVRFGTVDGEPGWVTCCVRDDGVGFEPQYADKLFQPFQRLHGSDEYPGTGIGLASVRRIVERHGGRVWAEARPGEGAAFYVTLPAAVSPRP